MIEPKHPHRAIGAHEANHGGIAQRHPVTGNQRLRKPLAIRRRSTKERHRPKPRRDGRNQFILLERQAIDGKKGEFVGQALARLRGKPRPRPHRLGDTGGTVQL